MCREGCRKILRQRLLRCPYSGGGDLRATVEYQAVSTITVHFSAGPLGDEQTHEYQRETEGRHSSSTAYQRTYYTKGPKSSGHYTFISLGTPSSRVYRRTHVKLQVLSGARQGKIDDLGSVIRSNRLNRNSETSRKARKIGYSRYNSVGHLSSQVSQQ